VATSAHLHPLPDRLGRRRPGAGTGLAGASGAPGACGPPGASGGLLSQGTGLARGTGRSAVPARLALTGLAPARRPRAHPRPWVAHHVGERFQVIRTFLRRVRREPDNVPATRHY
jgi:hypothetical protein